MTPRRPSLARRSFQSSFIFQLYLETWAPKQSGPSGRNNPLLALDHQHSYRLPYTLKQFQLFQSLSSLDGNDDADHDARTDYAND